MSKPRNNLRLFVGAYPPPELARRMLKAVGGLGLPNHRLTPPEQVHLTLQFIGDRPAKQLDETIESVKLAAGGLTAASLEPLRLISLPERGPVRLVAAETDAPPTLLELHRRLAQRLAGNVRRRPGDRFLPHITLCRLRTPSRMERVDEPLALPAFPLREIRLMRSTLLPGGAQHHRLAAFFLGDPAH